MRAGLRNLILKQQQRQRFRSSLYLRCASVKEKKKKIFSPQHPSSRPARLPSVQTTCSGSSGCTVVCTLVRLAGEARDDPRLSTTEGERKRESAGGIRQRVSLCGNVRHHPRPICASLKKARQGLHRRGLVLAYPGFTSDKLHKSKSVSLCHAPVWICEKKRNVQTGSNWLK